MREYKCQGVCQTKWHSAADQTICPKCGGRLIQIGATDEYRRLRNELVKQGMSQAEAIAVVNARFAKGAG